jgi:hypothetical protein
MDRRRLVRATEIGRYSRLLFTNISAAGACRSTRQQTTLPCYGQTALLARRRQTAGHKNGLATIRPSHGESVNPAALHRVYIRRRPFSVMPTFAVAASTWNWACLSARRFCARVFLGGSRKSPAPVSMRAELLTVCGSQSATKLGHLLRGQ